MKIDKKLIKELVDNLKEFELTELEYQDGQTKIKVSKVTRGIEQSKTGAVVSPNKTVLNETDDSDGIRVKSPIIGTAYLAPEPNAKKFVDIRTRVNKLGGYGLAGGGLAEATAKLKAQGLKKGGSPKKKKKFPDLSGDKLELLSFFENSITSNFLLSI